MGLGTEAKENIYGYIPSIPAAIIFIVLFSLTTGYHGYQIIKARSWFFIPFFIGGVFQVIGYCARVVGHSHTRSIIAYAIQTLTILLGPPLYAASVYMTLGRMVVHLDAQHLSPISDRWMTKIFVTGDVISFLTQMAGGSLMSTDSGKIIGSDVTIGGLGVQLLFFGFFVITSAIFDYRIHRSPTLKSEADLAATRGQGRLPMNWKTLLRALYVVSGLVLVRSIFRMVEFIYGYGGYIMRHEVFLYIFDSLLMFTAMVVLNVFHPSYILGTGKKQKDSGMIELQDEQL